MSLLHLVQVTDMLMNKGINANQVAETEETKVGQNVRSDKEHLSENGLGWFE
jgi:hypothetical protein